MASKNLSLPYQDIDDRLRNIGTPADSPSESGSLHAKVKALQDEPSLHDLWLKTGATYQAETNTYTLNDVSGITKEEMIYIWYFGKFIPSSSAMVQGEVGSRMRTNYPHYIGGYTNVYLAEVDLEARFNSNFSLKRIRFLNSSLVGENLLFLKCSTLRNAFWFCTSLETIDNILDISLLTTSDKFANAFIRCDALINVRLKGMNYGVSFRDCPNLSVEDNGTSTLAYAIENAINESPITVTLHANAFARVPETLIQKAQARQITIASA